MTPARLKRTQGDPPILPTQWLGSDDWWVWEMSDFAIPGLDSQVLVWEGGCNLTSCCYTGSPQAPSGTAAAWLVDIESPIQGLTDTVISQRGGSIWSSCCGSSIYSESV
jgi:hypothetical protein